MIIEGVRFLNQPLVKEGIKEVIGAITFLGCAVEIYHFATEYPSTTLKVVVVCTQLSVILACLTSRPGLRLCHWVAHKLARPETLVRLFGPSTNFVGNPWHPRHVASITASLLAIPAVAQSLYNLWMQRQELISRIQKLACFNFFTGRPFLHVVNVSIKNLY